jgi:hypothetical protein
VTALAAVAWPDVASAQDRSSADVYLIVVGSNDVPADFSQELGDVLASPPLALVHRVQVSRVDRVEPAELFDLHRTESAHPTAWVIVDGATVHVRTAGARRAQFVFRDITTSRPMTELDRERVGQTLRTAVSALIEGRPGALGRAQAQRAVDYEEPGLPVRKPEPVEIAPPLAQTSPEPLPADSEENGPVQFNLAASLQMARFDAAFAYAPGAIGSVEWTHYAVRPRVWLSTAEFLSHTYNPANHTTAPLPIFAASVRLGIGATVPPVPWLQVDLGVGRDWQRGAKFPDGPQTTVYRVAVRVGPTDQFRIRSSLTLSIEHVNADTIDFWGAGIGASGTTTWRPSLMLELWWV